MNCCGKKCINIITLIISVFIFIQTNFLTIMIFNLKNNSIEILSNNEQKITKDKKYASYESTDDNWKIIIPKIDISSIIKEGTSGEVINSYVGHFTETPKDNGNIGLIAASAGYKENYFENLKDLSIGDVIVYIKDNIKREYKVINNVVINETDWSYLSSTQDNRLTLITGILEEPKNRRCVQAVEIDYA